MKTAEQLVSRDKWIAALRSGNYAQITGALHTRAGFCCLGVLCDLADSAQWTPEDGSSSIQYAYEGSAYMPPHDVLKKVGITINDAENLASMNDKGKTFADIAAVLEAEDGLVKLDIEKNGEDDEDYEED